MFDQRSNLSLKREWKAVQTDYVIYCIFHELIVLHFHVVLDEKNELRAEYKYCPTYSSDQLVSILHFHVS